MSSQQTDAPASIYIYIYTYIYIHIYIYICVCVCVCVCGARAIICTSVTKTQILNLIFLTLRCRQLEATNSTELLEVKLHDLWRYPTAQNMQMHCHTTCQFYISCLSFGVTRNINGGTEAKN